MHRSSERKLDSCAAAEEIVDDGHQKETRTQKEEARLAGCDCEKADSRKDECAYWKHRKQRRAEWSF